MLLRKGIVMWIVDQSGRNIFNLNRTESLYFSTLGDISYIGLNDGAVDVFKGGEPECERIFQAIIKAIASGDKLFSIPEFHEKYLNATNGNEE